MLLRETWRYETNHFQAFEDIFVSLRPHRFDGSSWLIRGLETQGEKVLRAKTTHTYSVLAEVDSNRSEAFPSSPVDETLLFLPCRFVNYRRNNRRGIRFVATKR